MTSDDFLWWTAPYYGEEWTYSRSVICGTSTELPKYRTLRVPLTLFFKLSEIEEGKTVRQRRLMLSMVAVTILMVGFAVAIQGTSLASSSVYAGLTAILFLWLGLAFVAGRASRRDFEMKWKSMVTEHWPNLDPRQIVTPNQWNDPPARFMIIPEEVHNDCEYRKLLGR